MTFFKNFTPVHLQVKCWPADFGANPSLFISFCLEEDLESFVDSPCTVALNWAEFDPLPIKTRNFMVIMTADGSSPDSDPYIKVDLREEQAMARAFTISNWDWALMFITPYFRMPPDPIKNKYNSLTYFTVPKSALDKGLQFYVVVKDDTRVMTHAMPNMVIGVT